MRNEILVCILAGVVLLRIPSLLEPYWYGDEGIYLTIGQALRHGSQLYAQIHDNKPPFLYLVAAAANGTQFWFRFLTLIWNVVTVGVFWQLTKKWFSNSDAAKWTTVAFALLTSLPLLEGNIGNAELYFLLTTVTAFYWLYHNRSPFWGGLILGLGALFKIPALLEAGIWPLFWFSTRDRDWFKKSFWIGIGALLPLVVSGIYFFWRGTGHQYLIATGLQNIPYLSSWQAPIKLPIRAAIAALLVGIVFLLRKLLSHRSLLLGFGGAITLFAATLSGRPYPHYLLQMVPLVCLGLGLLVWGEDRERYVFAALATIVAMAFLVFHFYTYPNVKYYANFANFVSGRITKNEYFAAFSPDTLRNYQIAKVVAAGSMLNDRLFIWGDQPMIYALSRRLPVGRYISQYHINDFHAQNETLTALMAQPPRYIVTFSSAADLPGLATFISQHYVLETQVEGVPIYRRFDRQAFSRGIIVR